MAPTVHIIQKTILPALIVCIALSAYVVGYTCFVPESLDDDGLQLHTEHTGAVHTAAATILALTIFGSILGVRVSEKGKYATRQAMWLLLVLVCAGIVVLTQSYVMSITCCDDMSAKYYHLSVHVTAGALIGSLIGFGMVIGEVVREKLDSTNREVVDKPEKD